MKHAAVPVVLSRLGPRELSPLWPDLLARIPARHCLCSKTVPALIGSPCWLIRPGVGSLGGKNIVRKATIRKSSSGAYLIGRRFRALIASFRSQSVPERRSFVLPLLSCPDHEQMNHFPSVCIA